MQVTIDQAINICRQLIGIKPTATQAEIDDAIKQLALMDPNIDRQRLRDELIRHYNIQIENFMILEGNDARQPWLNRFRETQPNFPFWARYKRYLIDQKGLSMRVAGQLDTMTDRILDNLFNPLEARENNYHIFKKGMVVGQVQSGKTSNYTGLICKAADAGFNLIIVLAGIHNSLRSQTQSRIDEGFLGFSTLELDNAQNARIGVGFDVENEEHSTNLTAHALTTAKESGDFNQRQANGMGIGFGTSDPIILVIKKNGSPLRNLIDYLRSRLDEAQSKSVLIIDDEADNAGVNVHNADEDPSTINGYIRQLLDLFYRKAYVGYTATPYANIFIDPTQEDDLYPKDFIISLPAPSNYIGPDKVFATSASGEDEDIHTLPIVNPISDYVDFIPTGHRRDDDLPDYEMLPESLKHAVASFLLVCAIRYFRGQKSVHNSMLIHVSRFTNWQNRIVEIITQLFEYYRDSINISDPEIMEYFRQIYEGPALFESFISVTDTITQNEALKALDVEFRMPSWEELRHILSITTPRIVIKEINGSAGETLEYHRHKESGLSVIAIGGDRLSRGLTLEGLSVSYFLRASKMYDTLMQMGRWFGYRPGYVDLCRIYLSPELIEWFRHITIADEELRSEFKYMAEAGLTPDNFKLKVRNHPGNLQVTSAGKMRNGIRMVVSWAGRLAETYQLSMNPQIRLGNFDATCALVNRLFANNRLVEGVRNNTSYLWRDVAPATIIDFLRSYKAPESLRKVDLDLIVNYIESCQVRDELSKWSVVVMNKVSNAAVSYNLGHGINGGCFDRTPVETLDPDSYYIRKNHIVGNPTDEFLDLDDYMLSAALDRTRELRRKVGEEWNRTYPSPQVVRSEFRNPKNGLLILYPLNPIKANTPQNGTTLTENDVPFIGFAIAFPHSKSNGGVEYVVTSIEEFKQTEDIYEQDADGNN